MGRFVKVVAAGWLIVVFAFLQLWFWSGVVHGAGGEIIRIFVCLIVFVLVGLAPVKLIKIIGGMFK